MNNWTTETAEWYAANYGEYPTNRLAVDALALAADAAVVDIGCGTGAALRHAAACVTVGTLIGIDPVPRMVEIARSRTADHPTARIRFHVGSAEALPLPDGCADVVLAFDSIDHWQDVAVGLAEVRRILRPDGRLAIVKDGGVPGASAAAHRLTDMLAAAGFAVLSSQTVTEDDVQFGLWVCCVR